MTLIKLKMRHPIRRALPPHEIKHHYALLGLLAQRPAQPSNSTACDANSRLVTLRGRILAKEFVRQSPELKESFSSAATAAKTLAKEQAEALSAEESALGKIKSQLAAFRVK